MIATIRKQIPNKNGFAAGFSPREHAQCCLHRAEGPTHTSLGRRPGLAPPPSARGLNARHIERLHTIRKFALAPGGNISEANHGR